MPRQLDKHNFKRSGRQSYDFDTLLDGNIWQCYQGEDFNSEPNSFAQTCYSAARRRGIRCHASVQEDGTVIIQAYKPEPEVATEPESPEASADAFVAA